MIPKIALFSHDPEASDACVSGMKSALEPHYDIECFDTEDVSAERFRGRDIIAFPGGIGDASSYDRFFRRRQQNLVADYVAGGGRYLGICMGAYWAGSYYFDLLRDVDADQYIKQPHAMVKRSYSTTIPVRWQMQEEKMFFYDGCCLIGDDTKFTTYASYATGDAMAIIQGRVGVIGCHPESELWWYEAPRQYIRHDWHGGRHHSLLKDFVDQLMRCH
jgi:hypothetical protein